MPESRYLFAYGRYRRAQHEVVESGPRIISPEFEDAQSAGVDADLYRNVRGRRTTTLLRRTTACSAIRLLLVVLDRRRETSEDVQAAWGMLQTAVRALGHGLTGVRVIERDGRDVAVVQRRGRDFPLRELSDGYQAMLVIVLDLVLRMPFSRRWPIRCDGRQRW